jgi:hypothetical protein
MSDKRKAFEATVAKLEKLLPHLGSSPANFARICDGKFAKTSPAKLSWSLGSRAPGPPA